MLAELKPYPEYKDAREPWLGAIPAHWETRRNGRLFVHRVETGFPDLPVLEVSIKTGVRIRNLDSAARKQVMSDFGKYKRTCQGDIAYNMMRMWQGAVGVSPVAGLVSPAYVVARPHPGTNTRFYDYLFRTPVYMDEVNNFSRGIVSDRNRLYWDEFKQMPSPFPPPAEQAGIVRFLGAVDRKVNRFIRAKRRLIEVLTEQKQAIITHAVTKGLNPHAPLKPSGIGWLGDVPEHWEMWQIGHFAAVGNGSTPSRGNMAYWTGGTFPWLNSSTVNSRTISASDQYVTDTALRECHLPRVPAGSVLVAITGQGKTRGMAAVLTIEATINQHLAFIRPRSTGMTASPEYLRLFLHAAYPELRRMSDDSGSTKGALTCEDLRHFRVALMPRAEQEAVVSAVAEQTRDVDAVIDRTEREIDLIREYRTRLVADVVTGKVDVQLHSWAADDPERDEAVSDVEDIDIESGATESAEAIADDFDGASKEANE